MHQLPDNTRQSRHVDDKINVFIGTNTTVWKDHSEYTLYTAYALVYHPYNRVNYRDNISS